MTAAPRSSKKNKSLIPTFFIQRGCERNSAETSAVTSVIACRHTIFRAQHLRINDPTNVDTPQVTNKPIKTQPSYFQATNFDNDSPHAEENAPNLDNDGEIGPLSDETDKNDNNGVIGPPSNETDKNSENLENSSHEDSGSEVPDSNPSLESESEDLPDTEPSNSDLKKVSVTYPDSDTISIKDKQRLEPVQVAVVVHAKPCTHSL